MTAVAQIIQEQMEADHTPPAKPGTRSDDDYVISALANGLKVVEALQGQAYEAVAISEVSRRTGLTYDFCRRGLKTLKVCGWAVEDDLGWRLSVKAMQFSDQFLSWAAAIARTPIPAPELTGEPVVDFEEVSETPIPAPESAERG